MKIFTDSFYKLAVLAVILSGVLTVNYLYADWTAPTETAPGGNVAVPINTGAGAQTKSGDLDVDGMLTAVGLGVTAVTVSGETETQSQSIRDDMPSIIFKDTDSAQRRWMQRINNNTVSFIMDRDGDTDFDDESQKPMLISGGSSMNDPDDDFLRVANQVQANEYCDRSGNDCITPSAIGLECVSGRYKENGDKTIWNTTLNNSPSFNAVFAASNGADENGNASQVLTCQNEWVLTGCSASTDGNTGGGDNDEAMVAKNECRGDQVGTNAVHARCCRVVIN